MTEEELSCPSCGMLISQGDEYCRKCGANLKEISQPASETAPSEETVLREEPYERRFSLAQRFFKLLTSPSKAMEEIASAPSYEGIVVITIAEFIVMAAAVMLVSRKIELSGPYSPMIDNLLSLGLILGVLGGLAVFAIKWAIKSYLVKLACDNQSGWGFKAAASITSYAYVSDIIIGILGLCISWFLLPKFHIDTTNVDAARRSLYAYEAEINWLQLTITFPLSFLGLLWKSYLGGLGAHFGTEKKCSVVTGFAVFFVLGLVGLFVSFII